MGIGFILGFFQEGCRKQYFRVRGCLGRAARLLQAEQTFALQLTFSSEVPVILAVVQPAWTLPFSKAIALSGELLLFPKWLESTSQSSRFRGS